MLAHYQKRRHTCCLRVQHLIYALHALLAAQVGQLIVFGMFLFKQVSTDQAYLNKTIVSDRQRRYEDADFGGGSEPDLQAFAFRS